MMKPSLPRAGLFAAALLFSLSSFASAQEATICAPGAAESEAESSGGCAAFFESGAPLSSAEVVAITASALPAQARSEADSSPFNATVPCPKTVIIGSGIDASRVEAQVREREGECRWRAKPEKKKWHRRFSLSHVAPCLSPLRRLFFLLVREPDTNNITLRLISQSRNSG